MTGWWQSIQFKLVKMGFALPDIKSSYKATVMET